MKIESLRLLHIGKRLLPLLVAMLPLLGMTCGMFEPGPPKTPDSVPVSARSMLMEADQLPKITSNSSWKFTFGTYSEHWQYARPVTVASALYGSTYGTRVSQVILQMQDAVEGRRLWEFLKDQGADSGNLDYIKGEVTLLSLDELPPLHADQVALICHKYGSIFGTRCAARLQYKMFVVEIMAEINQNMTSEVFYEIVGVADEAMRPIWENWPVPTPASPIATPTRIP